MKNNYKITLSILIYLSNIGVLLLTQSVVVSAQHFAPPQNNPFSLTWASNYSAPSFTDLDGDGNLDLMSGSVSAGFYYYMNSPLSTGILEKIRDQMLVIVYPNPSSGKFVATINNSKINAIEIYNLVGEKIYQTIEVKAINQLIDLSAQPKGIYIVKINDGEKFYIGKIMIN